MITVSVLINGQPIYTRSAVNRGPKASGECRYDVDDGSVIDHMREDGAVALAHKLLDTIEESR